MNDNCKVCGKEVSWSFTDWATEKELSEYEKASPLCYEHYLEWLDDEKHTLDFVSSRLEK